jgi:poly(A) polymerase
MNHPKATEERARAIVARLVAAGFPAYFAGGAVRDRLRGVPPIDIDIATAASPEQVASLFEKTIPVGASFGVVMVLEQGEPFEVATFRSEGPYGDGRRPDWVTFADPKADVARRDFTINGLLYDPLRDEVLDWVGGREDVRRRLIRSIGDPRLRFEEDKLRMLRAVRFASTLGFSLEERTERALAAMAAEIRQVSAERIAAELVKIFTGPRPAEGLLLLERVGLLEPILPEVARLKGVAQDPRHHPEGDVFTHTVKIVSLLDSPTVSLAFAALLHDVGKPLTANPAGPPFFPGHAEVGAEMASAILDRLRFPRLTRERVAAMVANHLRFFDVKTMRRSTLRRFMARENYGEELELHRLDCLASSGDLANWEFLKSKEEEFRREPLPQPPLLRGSDLLEKGFRPGPRLGKILREVEEERLEGRLASREDALRWVLSRYPPGNEG